MVFVGVVLRLLGWAWPALVTAMCSLNGVEWIPVTNDGSATALSLSVVCF